MQKDSLDLAIREAKRFLEKASKVKTITFLDIFNKKHTCIAAGVDSAATKRASLDLTRALAAMRRP